MITPGLSDREQKIISAVASENGISIQKLSKIIGVSTVTIRSDLNSLTEKGIVMRTRGGVTPTFNTSVLQRQQIMFEEKNRIAQAAAEMIREGDTVMVEAGTTTALIGKYLLGKWNIRIVTNSLLIIPYLRINPGVQLCMVGGDFRPFSETFVGPMALDQLENFHVRFAFVGTDGFSVEHGFTSHMMEAAEIVRKMAEQAETVVLLADSSKYGKKGFASALPITGVKKLITDQGLDQKTIESIIATGVDVLAV